MEALHGGDWAGFEKEYGRAPLDFSANVSPLGLPEAVRRAAAGALETAERYPDPLCRALRAALAEYHGVGAEKIVCGNGAADMIYRICRAVRPRRAAVFAPGFAEYRRALEAEDCEIAELRLSEARGFQIEAEDIDRIPEAAELVFVCNPNNPTGLLAGRDTMEKLLDRCRARGTLLAVDECFLDFCESGAERSLVARLTEHPELVILKAFTKTHAMAGLRLGYALCGSAETAQRIQRCEQPWAVSAVAQAAGVAALQEKDYANRLRALVSAERRRMSAALTALGLRVIPGEANFLLFQSTHLCLAEELRARGILIRDCANFAGLGPGWYRTALRTTAENDALLTALGEVLHG